MATTSEAKIYGEMLDRLYSAVANGPGLNCRPHTSRQRVDLCSLTKFDSNDGGNIISRLLTSQNGRVQIKLQPPVAVKSSDLESLSEEERSELRKSEERQRLLNKLRNIAEDAKTYQQDTGAHVLYLGYPLLSLPPGHLNGKQGASKRVIAPIALIPVQLTVTRGRVWSVELSTYGSGADLVIENPALDAWLEQQTGKTAEELFKDEEGQDPYREINELSQFICKAVGLPIPEPLTPDDLVQPVPRLDSNEKESPQLLRSAVLGIFPLSNQSLIHDMEAMADGENVSGPVKRFVNLEADRMATSANTSPKRKRVVVEERLVTDADPCQARAVRSARGHDLLAVHGPPGTGKSQTIANMVGDHLARGERVLLVCDKRTAIDVVYYRLQRIGLGDFCAVVHDAQADQKDLYMSVREQLEKLPDIQPDPTADSQLSGLDTELQKLHDELTQYANSLFDRPNGNSESFHELMGLFIEKNSRLKVSDDSIKTVPLALADSHEKDVREILQRGKEGRFIHNPWADKKRTTPEGEITNEIGAAGLQLDEFVLKPVDEWKDVLQEIIIVAAKADALAESDVHSFPTVADPSQIGTERTTFATELEGILSRVSEKLASEWAKRKPNEIKRVLDLLSSQTKNIELIKQGPLNAEFIQAYRAQTLTTAQIIESIGTLDTYLDVAPKWYSFLAFSKKSKALEVLTRFGVSLTIDNAKNVRDFLLGLRARLTVTELYSQAISSDSIQDPFNDTLLLETCDNARILLLLVKKIEELPALTSISEDLRSILHDSTRRPFILKSLKSSKPRGDAISKLDALLRKSGMFSPDWLAMIDSSLRQNAAVESILKHLSEHLDGLESILRMRYRLDHLPSAMKESIRWLLEQSAEPEEGWISLRKAVINGEINRRIKQHPHLFVVDGKALGANFERYRQLDLHKRTLVRKAVINKWLIVQRERLLATSGSRLSGLGADLKRRLTVRGRNAMRLRQVIKTGAETPQGDPLFDLRPVWMASPSTVSQIFPRKQLFDLIIFDEASQCRLEEALPVLTRGKRVVVAGDPKQLPPTRFFESAVAQSDDDSPETDEDVWTESMSSHDDLLSAVLEKSVENAYLDVHYRSRNSDLIAFSNESFYDSRLQPIPGHPSNRPLNAPLRLHHVGGLYEKRVNEAEAEYVVKLVRELLKRSEPPSIGIACFNLTQREAIIDALDEAAASDTDFAARLAIARNRQGSGSFEGLFVKNLENVQGDERDYMIISTTYGPDRKGKFYRRFGPLLQAGGGRRLNVLVTRAREEVHLVTSIPKDQYRSLIPVPEGQQPNGGWLLFAYLKYAEDLEALYEQEHKAADERKLLKEGSVVVKPSKVPSRFAQSFAHQLARIHSISSTVHWGNDGFCVDVALHHPTKAEDMTLGICCDMTRYDKAEDHVEWELFRTAVLESQGWKIHRVWTPQFARDANSHIQEVRQRADQLSSDSTS